MRPSCDQPGPHCVAEIYGMRLHVCTRPKKCKELATLVAILEQPVSLIVLKLVCSLERIWKSKCWECYEQEAQQSQRGRAMLHVIEYFAKSLEMVPFDKSHTSSCWRSMALPILYHCRDEARHWSKIVIFYTPPSPINQSINQKRIKVTKVTNVTARPLPVGVLA